MGRVIIARHGNTFDAGDIVTRVGARTDLPLSTSGMVQAEKLREHFSPESSDWNFVRAYCSPLRRTKETADKILEAGHGATTAEAVDFLTEIDYGIDENKAESEVVKRLGKAALEAWDKTAVVPDGWKVNPKHLIESWKNFLPALTKEQGDTLIVTSNGIARFALSAFPNPDAGFDIKLKTAAYGLVVMAKDDVTIESWNQRTI